VEKEIENIRYYANIIEPRYGYQVVLKIHAEPETFSCEIPNLLLQPLVENAFFHGFQNSKRGKILLFLTMDKQKGDCLHCEIIDNGDGIEPELFRQIMNDSAPRKSSTRIGIRNIKERLELLYPGKSSFHITNEYGYGLSVEMIFPAHPDGGGQQLQREDPALPS
jgi:two-component system sensor histidine kinase YesM